MRHFLVVTSLLAFSALASAADADSASTTAPQPSAAASGATTAQAAAAPAAPRIVCHRETPTGSSIPRNVCEREDTERDQQLTNDLAAAAARNRVINSGSRGG